MRAHQWIIWKFIRDRYHPYRYHMSGDDMLMTIQIVNEEFFNEWKCDALTIVVSLGGWRTKSEEGKWNIFGDRRWRVLISRSNSVGFSQSALISFSTTPQTRTGGVRFPKIKISQQPPRPTHAGLINSFSIHRESWVWSDSTFNGIRVFVQKKKIKGEWQAAWEISKRGSRQFWIFVLLG